MAEMYDFILTKLMPMIETYKIKNICDYGCGDGELLEKLNTQKKDLSLTGIDYFSKFGDKNPQNNKSDISYIDRESAEYEKLSELNKFDMVLSTFALHHFQYPIGELQLLTDLVKSGGYLVFVDLVFQTDNQAKIAKNISSYIEEMGLAIKGHYHRHHYTLEEVKDLIKAIPVEIVTAEEITNELTEEENNENIKIKLDISDICNFSLTAFTNWLPPSRSPE